jgi:hypothetical protein
MKMRMCIAVGICLFALNSGLAQVGESPEKKAVPVDPAQQYLQLRLQEEKAASAPKEAVPIEFQFDGGSLRDFLRKVKEIFKTDIESIGDVPRSMLDLRVPKLRMKARWYRDVLMLYNEISFQNEQSGMGKWIIKDTMDSQGHIDPTSPPRALLLVGGAKDEVQIGVKAFAFPAQNLENFELFSRLVDEEITLLREFSRSDRAGSLRYHQQAGIVVAIGEKSYTELVSELIHAFVESAKTRDIPLTGDAFVVGQVNQPGPVTVRLDQKLSLLDLIYRAGGLTPRGNPNKIKFTRQGQPERVFSLDELKKENGAEKKIYVQPGDRIEIMDKLF